MKKLSEKVIIETSIVKCLIDGLLSGVLITFILYLILSNYNEKIINVLKFIESGKISVLKFVLIAFPLIVIITLMVKLVYFVINCRQDKN